mmetsp:Transcript_21590/g.66334  ORF Transcript_21590/g.66334 Transcript_21590/m.66334 type:complete len:211 (+) Transcript_21590:380-1012(+)
MRPRPQNLPRRNKMLSYSAGNLFRLETHRQIPPLHRRGGLLPQQRLLLGRLGLVVVVVFVVVLEDAQIRRGVRERVVHLVRLRRRSGGRRRRGEGGRLLALAGVVLLFVRGRRHLRSSSPDRLRSSSRRTPEKFQGFAAAPRATRALKGAGGAVVWRPLRRWAELASFWPCALAPAQRLVPQDGRALRRRLEGAEDSGFCLRPAASPQGG